MPVKFCNKQKMSKSMPLRSLHSSEMTENKQSLINMQFFRVISATLKKESNRGGMKMFREKKTIFTLLHSVKIEDVFNKVKFGQKLENNEGRQADP